MRGAAAQVEHTPTSRPPHSTCTLYILNTKHNTTQCTLPPAGLLTTHGTLYNMHTLHFKHKHKTHMGHTNTNTNTKHRWDTLLPAGVLTTHRTLYNIH